jgi:PAS domain S-box-containing protein
MSSETAPLRLAAIADSSDDAIVGKTIEGIVTSWNRGAERIFGYSAAEMVGSSITRLLPPDRLPEEADFLARLARGERIEHFETTRLTKGGRLIDVSVTLSPIVDERGVVVGASKIARDISDRRRLERAADAQRKLREVTLASIGDAVLATDTQARVTFMNPVAEALTGWTASEAAGQPLDAVLHIVNERSRLPADNPVARVLKDGHVVGLANHTVLLGRHGGEHPIDDSAAPIHDDEGTVFGVVLVFRDVSARRAAEQNLVRLGAIVESSDDAIITKTLGGVVTSWNPAAERIFGYPAAEAVGRPMTFLFPPERLGEEAEFLQRLGRGERIQQFETERIRKDGRRIQVSVTMSPLRSPDGEIVGVSTIARDITERSQLLQREQAARREAQEANRLKDEFLATLSHELRTPLNAILGWTRMLRMGLLDAAATARALEVIDRNCRVQADLIADLLDVSRIISGRLTLESRPVDVRTPVQAAIDAVRPAALAKRIEMEAIIDPDLPMVTGDSERLQQVFWNLLVNAVKFTGRQGRVTMRARSSPSTVEISVSDNGTGIRAEDLPHIFERFRQADSSASRSQGGLGIGLALVRHLVELQGGTVRASSDGEGAGSTFTVRLPVRIAPLAEGPEAVGVPPSRTLPRLDEVRILLVEDDDDARDLVKDVLERCGAAVTTVASTPAALLLLRETRPDVLVSDIGMPGLDGYDLIRRMRQMEQTGGRMVPAIALTAYVGAEDRRRAMESGYQVHIPKPIDPLEVASAIAHLLHRE